MILDRSVVPRNRLSRRTLEEAPLWQWEQLAMHFRGEFISALGAASAYRKLGLSVTIVEFVKSVESFISSRVRRAYLRKILDCKEHSKEARVPVFSFPEYAAVFFSLKDESRQRVSPLLKAAVAQSVQGVASTVPEKSLEEMLRLGFVKRAVEWSEDGPHVLNSTLPSIVRGVVGIADSGYLVWRLVLKSKTATTSWQKFKSRMWPELQRHLQKP